MTTKKQMQYSDDTRLALLEQSIIHINETMLRMEHRFDKIDERFNKLDERFNKIDDRFDKIDAKIDSHFRWNLSLTFGLYAMAVTGLLGALGKAFGWY